MSKYTTELRYICETYADRKASGGYGEIAEIMEKARPKLFSFDYPIFDAAYKKPLETKIMRHFYMREIGLETVGQFKFFLEMKMNEIMPYYNKLYESELIKFNPMHDFDYSETSQKKGSGNDSKNSTGSLRTGNQTDSDKWNTGKTTGTESSTGNVTGSGTDSSDRTWNETDDTTTHDGKDTTTSSKGTGTKTTQDTTTVTGNSETVDNGGTNTTVSSTVQDTGTVKDAADNLKWNYFHDTPQGNLDNINNASYLTNATKDTEDLKNTRTNDLTRQENGSTEGTSNNTQTTNGKTTTESNGSGKDTSETSGTENVTEDGTVNVVKSGTENANGTWSSKEDSTGNVESSGTSEGHETGKVVSAGTQESTGNVTGEYSTLDDYIRHVAGKSQGKSYSQMLTEFRSTFLNIDMMVIDDLEELFMGLY